MSLEEREWEKCLSGSITSSEEELVARVSVMEKKWVHEKPVSRTLSPYNWFASNSIRSKLQKKELVEEISSVLRSICFTCQIKWEENWTTFVNGRNEKKSKIRRSFPVSLSLIFLSFTVFYFCYFWWWKTKVFVRSFVDFPLYFFSSNTTSLMNEASM